VSTAVTILTSALLAALFAAAVRFQFTPLTGLHQRRSVLNLQYHYHLFAPRPVRDDLHLVVRDFDADGTPRPCREVPLTILRRVRDAWWNPNKRRFLPLRSMNRTLSRCCTDLADLPAAAELSLPYLDLLAFVSALPADGAYARQFVLVACFGTEPELDAEVLFCSAVHRLPQAAAQVPGAAGSG
jgi:hypothetical protein